MQEFIQQAMKALGTSEDTTKAATGGVLALISKNAPKQDVEQLMGKLPGAEDLVASTSAGVGETAGGGLGGFAAKAGAMAGGLGGGAGLIGMLQQSGLSPSVAPKFLSMFADFAKQKAGANLVDRIMGAVPGFAEQLAHK